VGASGKEWWAKLPRVMVLCSWPKVITIQLPATPKPWWWHCFLSPHSLIVTKLNVLTGNHIF
jgi:hypothetical protein